MTNNSFRYVKVLLVRHGQTDWNVEKRFLGRTDQPLNSIGLAQADEFANQLNLSVDAVYSSPLLRAKQTATAVHRNPTIFTDLMEMNQGQLEGLTPKVAIGQFPAFFSQWVENPEHAQVPGGETLGECRNRGLAVIHHIAARHVPGETIVIVSHQLVLASILCTLAKKPLTAWRDFRFQNLGAALLHFADNKLLIEEMQWKP